MSTKDIKHGMDDQIGKKIVDKVSNGFNKTAKLVGNKIRDGIDKINETASNFQDSRTIERIIDSYNGYGNFASECWNKIETYIKNYKLEAKDNTFIWLDQKDINKIAESISMPSRDVIARYLVELNILEDFKKERCKLYETNDGIQKFQFRG